MNQDVILIMVEHLDSSFIKSAEDRKKMHEIEWDSDSEISILGEVEILADSVSGVAMSCLKSIEQDKNILATTLQKYSIYHSPLVIEWVAKEAKNFPNFLSYIVAIENLRVAACTLLEMNE